MEFCTNDHSINTNMTDTTRGLYPAPDADTSDSSTVPAAPRRLRRSTPVADDVAEVRAMSTNPAAPVAPVAETHTSIAAEPVGVGSILCVIEPNADIAEGLQHLLHTVPGVERVMARATTAELLREIVRDARARAGAGAGPDVVAFSAASVHARVQPDIVLLDTGKACDRSARSWQQVREQMLEVQRALPGSALVLMSVYPERLPEAVSSLAAASIRKDTTRQELATLITQVRADRTQADPLADAAGA